MTLLRAGRNWEIENGSARWLGVVIWIEHGILNETKTPPLPSDAIAHEQFFLQQILVMCVCVFSVVEMESQFCLSGNDDDDIHSMLS